MRKELILFILLTSFFSLCYGQNDDAFFHERTINELENILHKKRLQKQTSLRTEAVPTHKLDSTVTSIGRKLSFLYNAKRQCIREIYSYLNYVSYRSDFTYNNKGNLIQKTSFNYEISTSEGPFWTLSTTESYIYDSNDNLIEYLLFHNQSNYYTTKREYQYDANGNISQMTVQVHPELNSTWNNSSKENYTCNTDGKITQKILYNWDETTNQWKAIVKYDYTYNAKNQNSQIIASSWVANQLRLSQKSVFSFDSKDNKSLYQIYDWDITNGVWVEKPVKYDYSYNNAYTASDLVLPLGEEYDYIHKRIRHRDYFYEKETWKVRDITIYNYSELDVFTTINDNILTENNGIISPNPASDYVTFYNIESDLQEISLYNSAGKLVTNYTTSGHSSYYIGNLEAGLYYYTVNTLQGKRYTGKLLKYN